MNTFRSLLAVAALVALPVSAYATDDACPFGDLDGLIEMLEDSDAFVSAHAWTMGPDGEWVQLEGDALPECIGDLGDLDLGELIEAGMATARAVILGDGEDVDLEELLGDVDLESLPMMPPPFMGGAFMGDLDLEDLDLEDLLENLEDHLEDLEIDFENFDPSDIDFDFADFDFDDFEFPDFEGFDCGDFDFGDFDFGDFDFEALGENCAISAYTLNADGELVEIDPEELPAFDCDLDAFEDFLEELLDD